MMENSIAELKSVNNKAPLDFRHPEEEIQQVNVYPWVSTRLHPRLSLGTHSLPSYWQPRQNCYFDMRRLFVVLP
jgi:hypothetical protein